MKSIRTGLAAILILLNFCLPSLTIAASLDPFSDSSFLLSGDDYSELGQPYTVTVLLNTLLTEPVYLPVPKELTYESFDLQGHSDLAITFDQEQQQLVFTSLTTNETRQNLLAEQEVDLSLYTRQIDVTFTANSVGDIHLQLVRYEGDSPYFSNTLSLTVAEPLIEENLPNVETTETSELVVPETTQSESVNNQNTEDTADTSADPLTKDMTNTRTGETDAFDWDQFATAIKNPAISKINVKNNITNPKQTGTGDPNSLATYQVKRSLEIDGHGFRIDFSGTSIYLGDTGTERHTFHLHDVTLDQRYAGAYSEDIVGSRLTAYSGKWRYRFGNITTEAGVQRLARAQYAEVTLYGKLDINTRAENFYLGSLIMEDGTTYKGNVNFYDFSIFYYNLAARATDTGHTKEFTIGANSTIYLTQTHGAVGTYPTVYLYYGQITIGENTDFVAKMPGNVFRFELPGSQLLIKENATVYLTSTSASRSVINYMMDNASVIAKPGVSFTAVSQEKNGLPTIDLSPSNGRANNRFILESPRHVDIKNLGTQTNATAINLGTTNRAEHTFSMTNISLSLWQRPISTEATPSLSYNQIQVLTVIGSGNQQKVTTNNSHLQATFKTTAYNRIATQYYAPTIEFDSITDAHLEIKARVKIGEMADNNGPNQAGEITYLPVYASKGQITGMIIDTVGEKHSNLVTDQHGYLSYYSDYFNQAGEIMIGVVIENNKEIAEAETVVIDITPPEPATITESITPQQTLIKGFATEASSLVTYTINGVPALADGQPIETIVGADGSWQLPIVPNSLVADDTLQFFLTDSFGNRNPVDDTIVHDALFMAGTILTVTENSGELTLVSIPSFFSFGNQLPISNQQQLYPLQELTGGLIIQDTRTKQNTFKLSAKMPQRLTSQSNAELIDSVLFVQDGQKKTIDLDRVILFEGTSTTKDPINLSQDWLNGKDGLFLNPTPGQVLPETYQGSIEWTLEDTPGNE